MLRAFAAVYRTGGVRPAARMLGVTHSSVSRFLGELEALCGTALVDRTGGRRPLSFTAEGELLARAALQSFERLEQTLNGIREHRDANSVVLETTSTFAARWLLPRLTAIEERLPRIDLSIVVDQRVRSPQESRADFAIRMGSGPWPDVEATPLMDDWLLPVMAPDYWRQIGEPSDLTSLADCRLLHDRDPQASWALWRKAFGPADLDTRKGPRYPSLDLVLRAAERGHGVALARRRLAQEALDAGQLVAPFGDHNIELPHSVWLVRLAHGRQRPAARAVIDCLLAMAE